MGIESTVSTSKRRMSHTKSSFVVLSWKSSQHTGISTKRTNSLICFSCAYVDVRGRKFVFRPDSGSLSNGLRVLLLQSPYAFITVISKEGNTRIMGVFILILALPSACVSACIASWGGPAFRVRYNVYVNSEYPF